MIIRPIARKDLEIFGDFPLESLLGMTSLPRNREKFLEKITLSETCFQNPIIERPGNEEYFFVLEDLATGKLGGICGIIAQSRQNFAFVYRIETLENKTRFVPAPNEVKILKVEANPGDSSEVCALYLQPFFRHSGLGRLLSLSRFLFIAAFPNRFNKKMVAEMRGYIDKREISPFWDSIGRHFCDLSFVELMAKLEKSHDFIPEILPKYPIYLSLLPKEAQEMIGKTHEQTKPAYEMLLQENFAFHQQIDIFEGGPILTAQTSTIRSIQHSAVARVDLTSELLTDETEFIMGNERLDYRSCLGKIKRLSQNEVLIHEEVAQALLVKKGDFVRYVSIHA